MTEAVDKIVIWDDVAPETFTRICQYAYTGDYTPTEAEDETPVKSGSSVFELSLAESASKKSAKKKKGKKGSVIQNEFSFFSTTSVPESPPDPTVLEDVAPEDQAVIEEFALEDHVAFTTNSWTATSPIKTVLAAFSGDPSPQHFANRDYPVKSSSQAIPDTGSAQGGYTANHNFTSVLREHVNLYVFADKYDIQHLRALVLQKLHFTLSNFPLSPKRIPDIVALIRQTYDNTMDKTPMQEDLRELATSYVVHEGSEIGNSEEFLEFIAEGGDFVRDVWTLMFHEHITPQPVATGFRGPKRETLPNR